MATITYEAKQDNVGALVPLQNRRRCLVVKYVDGKFGYVCGAFSTLRAAQTRADYLNKHEPHAIDYRAIANAIDAAVNDYAGDGLDARWEDSYSDICGR